MTQAEAARLRGVSRQSISKLALKGRLRTLEVGGIVFVHKDDVVKFKPEKGGRPKSKAK